MIDPIIIGDAFLYNADCRDVLAQLPDNSVDSIVTDPPYELGFMGNAWDSTGIAYDVSLWREAMRVLKPGGHLLSFGGARTYHRMACAIEDAGFEIRDQIMWIYGSGFPKSHNLEGEMEGWGTALKPAHEPICFARKPLIGTVAANVHVHGTGALNIDACRVATAEKLNGGSGGLLSHVRDEKTYPEENGYQQSNLGRWPANVIHDGSDEVLSNFPDAPGQLADASTNADARKTQKVYGAMCRGRTCEPSSESNNEGVVGFKMQPGIRRMDTGSAARFFYCAKPGKAERDEGLELFTLRKAGMVSNTSGQHMTRRDEGYEVSPRANIHPTVKPVSLMRYLWRLVTPIGGTGLDLFMGSGSGGKAAILEGFKYIGAEKDTEHGYFDISVGRITHAVSIPKQQGLFA